MAKKKQMYLCTACGADSGKWFGRCPSCQEWNSMVEVDPAQTHRGSVRGAKPEVMSLADVEEHELVRVETGISEFNLVCGGGIVPGSVILVGGEPGIGKSTLALQVARYQKSLYISGEESPAQLRHRAERLEIPMEGIQIATATAVEDILTIARDEKPELLIIDSIQTLYSSELPGIAGSVSQVRESAAQLVDMAKRSGIPVILIGHITKEGNIAGPKLLEHLVDTVLYFEGDFSRDFRMLRAFKNRFGSINEIGLFRMTRIGLEEVKEKNRVFLNSFSSTAPGSAVSVAIEGSRSMLFEVQSLVNFTSFANPRRMADGFDLNRLIIINAVLEKHGGLKLSSFDVFINVSGGFQINETAADLSVAMAIASSMKEQVIPDGTGFLGEISLSGDIRPVSQCGRRIQEFRTSGFETIIVSEADAKEVAASGFEGNIKGIRHISQAIDVVF